MKKIFLSTLLLLACLFSMAQRTVGTWSFIPQVGINLSNVSNAKIMALQESDFVNENSKPIASKYREGLALGANIQYQFASQTAVSAGTFFSVQGFRLPDFEGISSDKIHFGVSENQFTFYYLNVPLMLHQYIVKGLSLNIGAQIGFRLKGKGRAIQSKFRYNENGEVEYLPNEQGEIVYAYDKKYNLSKSSKLIDFSIPIGISYEFSNVILDARYNYGVTKAISYMGENHKNKVFMFTVGYQFDLQ